MSTDELIMEKLRALPQEKHREVLRFVESLHNETRRKRPRRCLRGLWADLGITVTREDIAEARREMWGSFPREGFFE